MAADEPRFTVRWWDERAKKWGVRATNLTEREAAQTRGILLGLHRTVEMVPEQIQAKKRSKR